MPHDQPTRNCGTSAGDVVILTVAYLLWGVIATITLAVAVIAVIAVRDFLTCSDVERAMAELDSARDVTGRINPPTQRQEVS